MSIVVGINLSTSRSLKRLLPFALEAKRKNYPVVFFDVVQNTDSRWLKKIGGVRVIRAEEMPQYNDVDILFTQDACLMPPTGAKVIAIPHSFQVIDAENTDPWAYSSQMDFLAGCHYLVLGNMNVTKFCSADFREMLSTVPKHLHLESEHSVIIPGGYPSLDLLAEEVSVDHTNIDSVFFAHVDTVEGTSCVLHTKEIINFISNKFVKKNIIYSPYPHSRSIQDAEILLEDMELSNVVLNTDYSSAKNYARSFLLITDSSTTAYTYSFATKRPHIQCQFYGKRKKPTRTKFGWVVYSLEQLEKAIDDVMCNAAVIEDELKGVQRQIYLNVGNSASYLIEHIELIKMGGRLPEWIKVGRVEPKILPLLEIDFIKFIYNLSPGREKIYQYHRALKAYGCAEGTMMEELKRLMTSTRSFTRENSHNLGCLTIADKVLSYRNVEDLIASKTSEPVYVCSSDHVDLGDFDFDIEFSRKRVIGNLSSPSCPYQGSASLEVMISNGNNFSMIVANDTVEERFSVVFDVFYLAKKNGFTIDIRGWDHVFGYLEVNARSARVLPTWEIKKLFEDNKFAPFAVWGCSGYYRELRRTGKLPDMGCCLGFIDNNAKMHGKLVDGLKLYSLERALKEFSRPFRIVLAVSEVFVEEIISQVKKNCREI